MLCCRAVCSERATWRKSSHAAVRSLLIPVSSRAHNVLVFGGVHSPLFTRIMPL